MKMAAHQRPSELQKELLVNLMEINEDLGRFAALRDGETNVNRRNRWQSIADELNAESGIQKKGSEWSDYWKQ